jgi:hypothetical protein
MSILVPTRQQLMELIEELPVESLPELANFLEYLRFKAHDSRSMTSYSTQSFSGSTFLLAIAGLGASDEVDLAERDEEILANEIDSVRGWGLVREAKA